MNYSKNKYLRLKHNLLNETFCRLAVSTIPDAGIGVIAIKDIPKGVNPFKWAGNAKREDQIIYISEQDLSQFNPNVQKLVTDFFFPEIKNGKKYFPVTVFGINSIDSSFYLNHSDTPNVDMVNDDSVYYEFRTNREITAGEELFINYRA
jgi:hypothetical protein